MQCLQIEIMLSSYAKVSYQTPGGLCNEYLHFIDAQCLPFRCSPCPRLCLPFEARQNVNLLSFHWDPIWITVCEFTNKLALSEVLFVCFLYYIQHPLYVGDQNPRMTETYSHEIMQNLK